MRKSFVALALALTLPAGIAFAEPQNVISPQQQEQEALQPGQLQQATEASSVKAYRANINPNVMVPTTGVYDQGDAFTNSRGFPLGGWSQIELPAD
jgi:hypothetical protein